MFLNADNACSRFFAFFRMSRVNTRNNNTDDSEERRVLTEKIECLESEIDKIKNQLNNDSLIESLKERISNCEALAGIVSPVSPKVDDN